MSNEKGFWLCIKCENHSCKVQPEYRRGSRKRSLTLKNAVINIEETFRTNRSIRAVPLADAALKKLALPEKMLRYQECHRLKKIVTQIVDGNLETQFACLISRLEQVKLHDSQTRINLRLAPV